MKELTQRGFVKVGSMVGAVLASTAIGTLEAQPNGYQAAGGPGGQGGPGGPGGRAKRAPGLQSIYALCEVTGGGKKRSTGSP